MRNADDKLWDLVLTLSARYGVKPNRDLGMWWEELVTALPIHILEAFVAGFEEMRDHHLYKGAAKETLEAMLSILYQRRVEHLCV